MVDPVGASGSYSNSAITSLLAEQRLPASRDEQVLAAKISRAMSSGPFHITREATVAEMDAQGNTVVLRQGTNQVMRTKSATCRCARIPWGCSG
jgi:hypothetical protein